MGILDKAENNIVLISTLIKSFQYHDIDMKTSVVNFMVKYMTDKEINKIYKCCERFLERTNQSVDDFTNFLAETE